MSEPGPDLKLRSLLALEERRALRRKHLSKILTRRIPRNSFVALARYMYANPGLVLLLVVFPFTYFVVLTPLNCLLARSSTSPCVAGGPTGCLSPSPFFYISFGDHPRCPGKKPVTYRTTRDPTDPGNFVDRLLTGKTAWEREVAELERPLATPVHAVFESSNLLAKLAGWVAEKDQHPLCSRVYSRLATLGLDSGQRPQPLPHPRRNPSQRQPLKWTLTLGREERRILIVSPRRSEVTP